jgi:hypothetical protein
MKSLNHNSTALRRFWFAKTHKTMIYLSAIIITTMLCSAVFVPLNKSALKNQNETNITKIQLTVLEEEGITDKYAIRQNVTFQVGEDHYLKGNVLFAFPEFFERYDINFVVGDPDLAFSDLQSVIITEEIADQMFKSRNPDCQIVRCGTQDVECQLKVTGIIEDIPSNGGIEVDYIVSAELLKKLEKK